MYIQKRCWSEEAPRSGIEDDTEDDDDDDDDDDSDEGEEEDDNIVVTELTANMSGIERMGVLRSEKRRVTAEQWNRITRCWE
jgi:hypothetical protein